MQYHVSMQIRPPPPPDSAALGQGLADLSGRTSPPGGCADGDGRSRLLHTTGAAAEQDSRPRRHRPAAPPAGDGPPCSSRRGATRRHQTRRARKGGGAGRLGADGASATAGRRRPCVRPLQPLGRRGHGRCKEDGGQPPRMPRLRGGYSGVPSYTRAAAGARHGSATAGQARSRRTGAEPVPASGPR